MPVRAALLILMLLAASTCLATPDSSPAGSETADTLFLRQAVTRLAAPECSGRRCGSRGNELARNWLLEQIRDRCGLEGAAPDGGFLQTFNLFGLELPHLDAALIDPDGGEWPLLLSLSAPPAQLAWVRLIAWPSGQPAPTVDSGTLLVHRGTGANPDLFSPSTLRREAEAAGADGLILVPNPGDSVGAFGRHLDRSRSRDPRLHQLAGDAPPSLLAYAEGEGAGELFELAGASPTGWRIELPGGKRFRKRGRNLAARLPGAAAEGPRLLLIAHYDHLGKGPEGYFPGADDNASGVATLLETARLLAANPPAAEIIFLFTDAEELGHLGAEAFARATPTPDRVINLDSVGRAAVESYRKLRDPSALNPDLLIHWSSSQAEAPPNLQSEIWSSGFDLQRGEGPIYEQGGDHWVFARRGVPSLFLFGGFHGDYNTVTDLPERIDVDRLARLAEALAVELSASYPRVSRP
jgi:hypothetical protein